MHCRRVASEASNDYDRGHDWNGIRRQGGKVSTHVIVSARRSTCFVSGFILLVSWSMGFMFFFVTKERYPL